VNAPGVRTNTNNGNNRELDTISFPGEFMLLNAFHLTCHALACTFINRIFFQSDVLGHYTYAINAATPNNYTME